MNEENINLDEPPIYITISSGMVGAGIMGFFLLDVKGLYIGILVGFIIGLLFYIRNICHTLYQVY